jgi:hypothetical protein
VRLVGRITNITDLSSGAVRAAVATEDGRTSTFGVPDSQILPEDWTVGLRVSFEEGVTVGEAKYVKFFSGYPESEKAVATVAIDGVKYVPFHYGGNSYADGVEVSYSYWVESGWRNYSMEIVPVGFSGDLLDGRIREPGHLDYGRSPNVSVFHPRSGVNNRIHDTPNLVCDGGRHSAKAVVGFGQYESVRLGADVSVRVTLRVTAGQSGNGVLKEVIAEETLTITEKSDTPHRSQAVSDDTYGIGLRVGDWTPPTRSW